MNMRISLLAALFWGILVISMSTGIVSAGSQAPRCTGVEACTGNTGTVAFGSCNGDLSCFSNTAPIAPDSCDDVALIHCVSRGGNSTTDGNEIVFGIGGNGALATLSVLTAYESNVYGGDGSVCCSHQS